MPVRSASNANSASVLPPIFPFTSLESFKDVEVAKARRSSSSPQLLPPPSPSSGNSARKAGAIASGTRAWSPGASKGLFQEASPISTTGSGSECIDDATELEDEPEAAVGLDAPLDRLLRRTLLVVDRSSKFCPTAYAAFKKSVGLPADAKLFMIDGNPNSANLDYIRAVLEERGYVENVWDLTRPFFDIFWGHRSRVKYAALGPTQVVNHYERDFELTSKAGLASHLRDCCIFGDRDSMDFCPPTFILNSVEAIDVFRREFMASKAMCVLRLWQEHIVSSRDQSEIFQEGVVRTALAVCRRHHQDIDELLDGDENEGEQGDFIIRRSEWDILDEVALDSPSRRILALETQMRARVERERVERQVQVLVERNIRELQQQEEHFRILEKKRFGGVPGHLNHRSRSTPSLSSGATSPTARSLTGSSASCVRLKPVEVVEAEAQERRHPDVAAELSGQNLLAAVCAMLVALDACPRLHACKRNIWIVKPSGKMRGQGIFLEDDVGVICRHANRMKGDLFGSSYICQQYIERPLLVGGTRKHDIRQWVAVTSVNPLTVWFFNECYVRLAANDFTLDNPSDLFTHLTNNPIISHHENYDPEDEFWRCQWDMATYRKHLREQFGSDVFVEKLLPQMKDIVTTTLKSVQEAWSSTEGHSSSFQLLGYDFLIDEDLRVWLLEVNNNPLMQPSCYVLERLSDACLKDLFRVVLDGEDGCHDRPVQFDLLFRGPHVTDATTHQDMVMEGKRISRPSQPPPAALSEEEVKAAAQKLQARRLQELQELADRKKKQKDKEQRLVEKAQRIRTKLRGKIPHQASRVFDTPQKDLVLDDSASMNTLSQATTSSLFSILR